MERAAQACQILLQDLMATLDGGTPTLQFELVEIDALVVDLLATLSPYFEQRRVRLRRSGHAVAAGLAQSAPPQLTQPPQRRTTYVEAVAVYERGLEALQRHDFSEAADLLESVLRQYPEEKELHERVRLYLNVCQRQATPKEAAPQTQEERLYAATLAINGGRYDQALVNLRLRPD